MSIEILSTKAINLPIDSASNPSNNQISQNDSTFFNNSPPVENQILNYKPEQFHNQGNSISAQIVESIAKLDSKIQHMNKEIESSTNSTRLYKHIQTESAHKSYSNSYSDHPSDRDIIRSRYQENSDKLFQTLTTVRKTMLTIKFVQAISAAFSKTLNKFLQM